MSETPVEELVRRLRFMIAMKGCGIDNSGDRTRVSEWVVARRWVHKGMIGIVRLRDSSLELRQWDGGVYKVLLHQTGDGKFFDEPTEGTTHGYLTVLRSMMVLDDLANV